MSVNPPAKARPAASAATATAMMRKRRISTLAFPPYGDLGEQGGCHLKLQAFLLFTLFKRSTAVQGFITLGGPDVLALDRLALPHHVPGALISQDFLDRPELVLELPLGEHH